MRIHFNIIVRYISLFSIEFCLVPILVFKCTQNLREEIGLSYIIIFSIVTKVFVYHNGHTSLTHGTGK